MYFYAACDRGVFYPQLASPDTELGALSFRDRFTGSLSTPSAEYVALFVDLTYANEVELACASPGGPTGWTWLADFCRDTRRWASPGILRRRDPRFCQPTRLTAPSGASGRTRTLDQMADPVLTLMAVHAHPDDEALGTGGVLARYADEGVRTVLVTCTNGELGDAPGGVKPGDPGHDEAVVVPLRLEELEASSKVLGSVAPRAPGLSRFGHGGLAPERRTRCVLADARGRGRASAGRASWRSISPRSSSPMTRTASTGTPITSRPTGSRWPPSPSARSPPSSITRLWRARPSVAWVT